MILKEGMIVSSGNVLKLVDLRIEAGKIQQIADHLEPEPGEEVMACQGALLMPGFIDAHVHLREPGGEAKETIETGTEAAAAGGYTTIMAMPNVKPVPDNEAVMRDYVSRLKQKSRIAVLPYSAITRGEQGDQVVDMEAMMREGAVAFSDDGVGVQSDAVMEEAMRRAAECHAMIVAHTEDDRLKQGGYVHAGAYSAAKGWRGIPSACEYAQVERDLRLAKQTGCAYHICHVSTKETIEMVRKAKAEGINVTCEVTPHHLSLIDEDVKDANGKMNPPLRSEADRAALRQAIQNGIADIVATDHAPHTREEKDRGLAAAPFGVVGLETAFPVLYTDLVLTRQLTMKRLQQVMSETPAERFGLTRKGKLAEGYDADLVLIDIREPYVIDPERFRSKGRNTPFGGKEVYGKVRWTMAAGKVVYRD